MTNALGELATSMAQACAFAECDFQMGSEEGETTIMSPPCKRALATWQTYYHSMINPTGQVVNRLLPLLEQCKAIDAESLKVSKIHLIRQMSSLKAEFDSHFERLLDKLNSLTGEISLKSLGENPQKKIKIELICTG